MPLGNHGFKLSFEHFDRIDIPFYRHIAFTPLFLVLRRFKRHGIAHPYRSQKKAIARGQYDIGLIDRRHCRKIRSTENKSAVYKPHVIGAHYFDRVQRNTRIPLLQLFDVPTVGAVDFFMRI